MKNLEEHLTNLRKAGLKITPQRRAIVEILVNHGNHPSAEEIYQELTQTMPETSLATVYNTLRELNQMGDVEVVRDFHASSTRYDPNTDQHNHLICLECGRIIDLEDDFNGFQLGEKKKSGFQILKKQVTFYGICPECQKRKQETSGD